MTSKLVPRRFRLLVFDWDGTLADSAAIIAEAIQTSCRDLDLPVPSDTDARFVIGLGLADALRHVAPSLSDDEQVRFSARYRHHYLARDPHIGLFAGAVDLLDELRAAGFMLAVATGKTRIGLERALVQQALAERFVASRCADEGRPKPHPDMLHYLMKEMDVAPAQTLMIGDTTHDLELARNAGVSAIGVSYGAHAADRLALASPLAVVHSIPELRQWLLSNA
jgi:phosphoglycolate phosphatase